MPCRAADQGPLAEGNYMAEPGTVFYFLGHAVHDLSGPIFMPFFPLCELHFVLVWASWVPAKGWGYLKKKKVHRPFDTKMYCTLLLTIKLSLSIRN